jgi:hypothetical protein
MLNREIFATLAEAKVLGKECRRSYHKSGCIITRL